MANRNAASIINQMKYSGIKQKQLAAGLRQEGIDNKAVSQSDRMLGKQVAGEESRMQDLDKFGSDLAMRKDKLSFAQKIQQERQGMADERLDMQDKNQTYDMIFKGIEGVVGATSTGVEFWRSHKQRAHDKIDLKEHKAKINYYQSHTGATQSRPPIQLPWNGDESY